MYLNTHSYYSLRYGAYSVETLLKLTQDFGYDTIALTDINNTSGCLEFIRKSKDFGVRPVVGVDFRNGAQQQFVLLAKNNKGFEQINHYLSYLLHKKEAVPELAPELEDVFVVYPFSLDFIQKHSLKTNEYIGIRPTDIATIRIKNLQLPKGVILQTASFRNQKDFNAHRLLRAIDNNTLLSKLPQSEQGKLEHQMLSKKELYSLYSEYPLCISNTDYILSNCSIDFDFSEKAEPQNQKTYTDSAEKDKELLLQLCKDGLPYRYPKANKQIHARIKMELEMIEKMGFISYFLINWDIVNYARSKGYFYVGRGSGANSIIAYLLRITDVDPIELDLYFERFINLYRKNPPDFDIDFSWTDREDITQYIFKRFKHVALVATYNTFQRKAVIRELGKVFGLPKEEIDQLSKGIVTASNQNHLVELVLKYAAYIHEFPSHLSVHSCGIVISEKPIAHFTATFLPPKGYPTIQFDMHTAEDVGLHKFDILSQRGLGKIRDTLDIIKRNEPTTTIDIHDMPRFKEDPVIKQMLREANAIGCFYVESPAMRMLLRKLQVDDYLGLVAASSVIRPGVAKSGMMSEYIKRFRHPEKRSDAHPVLLELMPDTYGVMVYQEDVIKVAHYFAGLTLGEADNMRRGMSGKFRSRDEFQAVKEKFFHNCLHEKGHSLEVTSEVWRQTESFAGYAFAKGHSASYAVESYQCLFLKAYYPLEFMVATINNYGGFYSTELYAREAGKFGGIVLPPCVNHSEIMTTLDGKNIYLGFHLVKSLDTAIGRKIEKERKENGPYLNFDDFLDRVHIGTEQLTLLVRINAFRFTGVSKRSLLWEVHLKTKHQSKTPTIDLFRVAPKEFHIPAFQHTTEEAIFDQIELLGFPLFDPFKILRRRQSDAVLAKDLYRYNDQSVWIEGYLIHSKRTTTSNGDRMFFGTFLDQEGEWLDTVHFPNIAARFPFRGRGVYAIYGKVFMEYDCILIEAEYMEKMEVIEDPRYTDNVPSKEQGIVTSNLRKNYWDANGNQINRPHYLKHG